MCDLRDYSGFAKLKETGEKIGIPYIGLMKVKESHNIDGPIIGDMEIEPGVYHVCASGSFYVHFDGEAYHKCYDDHPYLDFIFTETEGLCDHTDTHKITKSRIHRTINFPIEITEEIKVLKEDG